MKYIKYFPIIVLLFALCNNYDYNIEYDSYYDYPMLVNSQADTIPVDGRHNYYFSYHDSLGNSSQVSWDSSNIAIDIYVEDTEKDDKFVLVSQKPFDKILTQLEEDGNFSFYGDEVLEKSDFHEYWIILSTTNDIYGPLSLAKYKEFREVLNVPDELRLDFEKTPFERAWSKIQEIVTTYSALLFYIVVTVLFIGVIGLVIGGPIAFLIRFFENRKKT